MIGFCAAGVSNFCNSALMPNRLPPGPSIVEPDGIFASLKFEPNYLQLLPLHQKLRPVLGPLWRV